MADDDDVSGESFMAKHMSEAQPSREDGSFARRNANNRFRPIPDTDSGVEQKYGKSMDMSASQEVNSDTKGAKGSGAIGTAEWRGNKATAQASDAAARVKEQLKKFK